MSLAASTPAWELAMSATTVRQFGRALGVAGAAVLVGAGIYLVETKLIQAEERFMQNPADVMMRAFAIAHFLVGVLYLATSAKVRKPAALLRVAAAGLLGLGLCWLFAQFDSVRNPLLVMFFYGYFLVHEIRDETQIYLAYERAGPVPQDQQRALRMLSWTVALALMSVLAVTYLLHVQITGKRTALDRAPQWLTPAILVSLPAVTGVLLLRLRQLVRRAGSSLRGLLAAHMPLVLVFLGILGVLLFGATMGSTGLNLIILIHVTAWLVFVHHQLGTRPRAQRLHLGAWLRGTPAGFLVLHLGIMAIVLVLMAVRVHVWQRVGFVSELLASSTFTYWGLMHISLSFWSSR